MCRGPVGYVWSCENDVSAAPGRDSYSLRVSRGSRNGSSLAGCPALIWRPRSSSALNSAPSRIAMFEIHSQTRKTITPPKAP